MNDGELGKVYKDGEPICNEGDIGEVMYVVQAGEVKITKASLAGEVTIAKLKGGDIFGEMALFDKQPRSASAVAIGDARVLSVDKKKLFKTITRDPTLVFKILETMSQRIRKLNEELPRLKEERLDMLRAGMSVDDTCALVLQEAQSLVTSDNASIMLLDSSGETLTIKAAKGDEADPKTRLKVGKGVAGDVLKTGKAELVNNVSMDQRFVEGHIKITSMLCVPIKCNDRLLGVINMSNITDRLFTLDDLKLIHSLALNAAIAIESAINFSHLKDTTDSILRHVTLLDM
ncbi:MAG: cyclic nucleotide-binding domain-containing protein [Nitrospirota bacterium]|nr:MAG: cyclic nucleotide-binding domain-containing protein [Nitrospirota bacterium]